MLWNPLHDPRIFARRGALFMDREPNLSSLSLPLPARKEITRLAGLKCVHKAAEWFAAHESQLAELQVEMTAIPAPPFHEQQRSAWMLEKFSEFGLLEPYIDGIGNVIGQIPGSDSGPFIVLSAHIDTVFTETQIAVRRDGNRLVGPGVADNSAGLVALLALAGAVRDAGVRTRLPLLLLANVGEEGEGDLRGMRHFFDDPRWQGQIASLLALDGAGTDTIVTEALGSRRFEISIHGPGGHSWSDFGLPNPIVLLARVIDALSRIALPQNPRTSLNVGTIKGGTSVNAIPQTAVIQVDVRSPDPRNIAAVEEELRSVIEKVTGEVERSAGVEAQVRVIGDRPAAELPQRSAILEALRMVDAQLGIKAQIHCASTDANIPLSLGIPAVAVGAGGLGARAHTLQEWFIPRERELALKRILLTLLALAGLAD
jgi:acetylornithine deacetylase/succinyl-diaminopimelate desuccinylase-like protein